MAEPHEPPYLVEPIPWHACATKAWGGMEASEANGRPKTRSRGKLEARCQYDDTKESNHLFEADNGSLVVEKLSVGTLKEVAQGGRAGTLERNTRGATGDTNDRNRPSTLGQGRP